MRSKSMTSVFRDEAGAPPMRYLRNRRMDVAVRLLIKTDLPPWKVGQLVFGADGNSFYGRFSRWSKKSPKQFRDAARKAGREAAEEPGGQELREICLAIFLGEVAELELDPLDRLIDHLQAVRDAKAPAAPPALAIHGPIMERGIALATWERLRYLPAKEQKELVRQPFVLRTAALFDLLREKSREEGRKDRQAGVRIAELALASLDGIAAYLAPEELANTRAQGWAWLANAWRLALDYPEASRAFAKARKLLPEDPDPQMLAEICDLEADLCLFQSKFEKALELGNRAVRLFSALGRKEPLARALLARARVTSRARGFESAIPDLLEALQLLDQRQSPQLAASVHHSLLTAYAFSEQLEQAIEMIPVARAHCTNAEDHLLSHQLQWVEGHIARKQGRADRGKKLLLTARAGFLSYGELGYAAAVDLELAEAFLEQGREPEAVLHALRAMPVFERFSAHAEAMAALALLGQVAAGQEITLEAIHRIRGYLESFLQSLVGVKE